MGGGLGLGDWTGSKVDISWLGQPAVKLLKMVKAVTVHKTVISYNCLIRIPFLCFRVQPFLPLVPCMCCVKHQLPGMQFTSLRKQLLHWTESAMMVLQLRWPQSVWNGPLARPFVSVLLWPATQALGSGDSGPIRHWGSSSEASKAWARAVRLQRDRQDVTASLPASQTRPCPLCPYFSDDSVSCVHARNLGQTRELVAASRPLWM